MLECRSATVVVLLCLAYDFHIYTRRSAAQSSSMIVIASVRAAAAAAWFVPLCTSAFSCTFAHQNRAKPCRFAIAVRLTDVSVTGIRGVTAEQMKQEDASGKRIQVCVVARGGGGGG